MQRRKIISLAIAAVFLVIVVTGICMYIMPYEKATASIHTFFGLSFLLIAGLHIKNNWIALKNYSKEKKRIAPNRIPTTFLAISLTTILLLAGLYREYPPFNWVYEWGNNLRNKQSGITTKVNEYEILHLQPAFGEATIEIEVKKGPAFKYPLFAVWIEDLEGNYLQTLYVSRSIATSVFAFGKKTGNTWEPAVVRRPEALPRWSHKRGIKSADGYHIPEGRGHDNDLDGYTGATPRNNFLVISGLSLRAPKVVRVCMEVNQSNDWNEYYSKDRFPEDKIYSGSGKVGQPAVVYAAEINLNKSGKKSFFLEPVGHSHHSGETGELFSDFSNITTALEILDRVIVTLNRNNQVSEAKTISLNKRQEAI